MTRRKLSHHWVDWNIKWTDLCVRYVNMLLEEPALGKEWQIGQLSWLLDELCNHKASEPDQYLGPRRG